MSEKQELKKQIKICKRGIRSSNYAVRGFMRLQKYQKGSYQILQGTRIWSNAKDQLLHYHDLKYNQLICFKCEQEITSNPILHHKKYNWKKLFAPRYIGFVHRECHDAVHSVKRGYKRRLSYYQIKMLIIMMSLILVLIFFLINSLLKY